MSAIVLIGLPVIMLVALCFMNPTYASTFFTSFAGWMMLTAAAILLGLGAFWLSRLVKPKF